MSLILDALKKSEQERRRELGPDLQTIHQATTTTVRTAGKNWGWLALVVFNLVAIGAWWWLQREPAPLAAVPDDMAKAAVVTTPAPPPVKVPEAPQPVEPTPPSVQDATQFTRMEPTRSLAQPRVNATTPVEEFTDLPDDVRSSLPAMTFSFHVYSADPRNRTIIINNQRLREGEQVSAGVELESITEDGVILAMDHRRVHINVLTGW